MVFSSLTFLCIFLPVVWLLHTIVPNMKVKNGLLLLGSLLFYAYGEPVYVLLLIGSALLNYIAALLVGRKKSKAVLALAVIVNIGILGVFKYLGFVLENWNLVTGMGLQIPKIIMPIGISFFTFQALSYVIDVYRGKVAVQKNFAKVLLYIALFPQLIAGPIVRYSDIEEQIGTRTVTVDATATGLRKFILGLAKKVLIANAMGSVADLAFSQQAGELGALVAWIGAIAYLLQIYYDFSGYSDMAIGLGRMFGFHFPENFNLPYAATNMQDFWRRWHISLSTWFRDYVYIPLGGNRKGKVRTVLNRLIVFFLTGLWHGANWTFVVWGLFHGVLLLLEEVVPMRKLPRFFGHLYTLLMATLAFVVFRADTISQAWMYLTSMFTGFSVPVSESVVFLQSITPYFLTMLLTGILGAGPVQALVTRIQNRKGNAPKKQNKAFETVGYIAAVLLLLWCMIRLSGSSYNPFIYFRF